MDRAERLLGTEPRKHSSAVLSAMSQAAAWPFPPPTARSSPAAFSTPAAPRAQIATFAPSRANACAIARPMPRGAPVTIAPLPVSPRSMRFLRKRSAAEKLHDRGPDYNASRMVPREAAAAAPRARLARRRGTPGGLPARRGEPPRAAACSAAGSRGTARRHDAAEAIRIPATRRRRGGPPRPAPRAAPRRRRRPAAGAAARRLAAARERDGERAARLADLLRLGDPRDPARSASAGSRAQPRALPHRRRRARARLRAARALAPQAGATPARRRASPSSSRARRRSRSSAPSGGCAARATRCRASSARTSSRGRPSAAASRGSRASSASAEDDGRRGGARATSREIAATHSPYVIDLTAHLIRLLYTRGYGEALHYDRDAARRASTPLAQRHPVVFLPSHKSNLDHLVLQYALHENGHPPNHTAGGINMNFFPVGPARAAERRLLHPPQLQGQRASTSSCCASYIDYLIEKRFSLEWYIEGGRSRSGKLLPPRFGLLAYVVDAYRRGKSEDVYLIPVSIAYDQIQDVGDYVAEQRGGAKERESFGWFLRRRAPAAAAATATSTSASASRSRSRKALGPPDPGAEPDPDETEPRAPEARVRGVRSASTA